MANTAWQIAVVGAGPVGLALAGDLGWRGIACVLAERGDGIIDQPRMDMVGIRTMEFCRRWGIVPMVDIKKRMSILESDTGFPFSCRLILSSFFPVSGGSGIGVSLASIAPKAVWQTRA